MSRPRPKRVDPPLKWHGGKQYLTKRIVALMPPRCENSNAPGPADEGWLHYVEPYFGGGPDDWSLLIPNTRRGGRGGVGAGPRLSGRSPILG